MHKYVVWIPGILDPKFVTAKRWRSAYTEGSPRILFEGAPGKSDTYVAGIVIGPCAVFEADER